MPNLTPPYTKEIKFSEDLFIPNHKPPLTKLVRCHIIPQVDEYIGFTTPKGLSYEGEHLSGTAICILLLINEEITYIGDNTAQTLHVIHYTFYKNATLILPETYNEQSMLTLIKTNRMNILPTILTSHHICISPTHLIQTALISVSCSPY